MHPSVPLTQVGETSEENQMATSHANILTCYSLNVPRGPHLLALSAATASSRYVVMQAVPAGAG